MADCEIPGGRYLPWEQTGRDVGFASQIAQDIGGSVTQDTDDTFEEVALSLWRLVIAGDPRIGKIPRSGSPRR